MTKTEAINLILSEHINSLNEGYIKSNLKDIISEEEVYNKIQFNECFNCKKDYEIKHTIDGYIYLTSSILLNPPSIFKQEQRLTSTEIDTMAQDLESSLSDIYSILSQEFQLPLEKLFNN